VGNDIMEKHRQFTSQVVIGGPNLQVRDSSPMRVHVSNRNLICLPGLGDINLVTEE